jgi:hypothetical protein
MKQIKSLHLELMNDKYFLEILKDCHEYQKQNKENIMKRGILGVTLIFISMLLITGIHKSYGQTINFASLDPNIVNINHNELTVESAYSQESIQLTSPSIRFKTGSIDENWTLSVIATGQGGDVSIAKIGIDPDGKAYPYPPNPPPGFTVVLKVKGIDYDYSEDIRVAGSAQEVWKLSVMVAGTNFGGDAKADDPNFFPKISWDPNEIGPALVMDLHLGDANGPVLLDMETTNTYQTQEADADEYYPSLDYASFSYTIVFEPAPLFTYYRDADGDSYGDPNDTIVAEEPPSGYVVDPGDCDDSDPNTYLEAPEICDGKDNDCNKKIDVEIADPNNLGLALEELKQGKNKILINTFCSSYTSYDFLLNFKELLNIASLNLDRRDNDAGSCMSTYFFFGKICGKQFDLSKNPSSIKILYLY